VRSPARGRARDLRRRRARGAPGLLRPPSQPARWCGCRHGLLIGGAAGNLIDQPARRRGDRLHRLPVVACVQRRATSRSHVGCDAAVRARRTTAPCVSWWSSGRAGEAARLSSSRARPARAPLPSELIDDGLGAGGRGRARPKRTRWPRGERVTVQPAPAVAEAGSRRRRRDRLRGRVPAGDRQEAGASSCTPRGGTPAVGRSRRRWPSHAAGGDEGRDGDRAPARLDRDTSGLLVPSLAARPSTRRLKAQLQNREITRDVLALVGRRTPRRGGNDRRSAVPRPAGAHAHLDDTSEATPRDHALRDRGDVSPRLHAAPVRLEPPHAPISART